MDLIHQHRLADGRIVTIRPIQPSDYTREQAFLSGLSAESRYLRFHKWVSAPSDKLIHFLTDIDHDRHIAFVCTSAQGDKDDIVGEGRYVTEPGDTRCEFGIVIAEGWRKSGIAGVLMDTLIRSARARGLKEMEGIVLRSNSSMMRFSRALGFEVIRDPDDRDTVSILKRL
jgi:acetyltransferase